MSSETLCSAVQQKYFFYVVKNFYECKGTKIINIKSKQCWQLWKKSYRGFSTLQLKYSHGQWLFHKFVSNFTNKLVK